MNSSDRPSMRRHLARMSADDHQALHVHPWISRLGADDLILSEYASVLGAYHAFFGHIEGFCRHHGLADDLSLGGAISCLARDLGEVSWGGEHPRLPVPLALHSATEVMGSLYVLHGSGFGASTLSRSVARSLPGVSQEYLRAGTDPLVWRALLAQIEAVDPESREGRAMTAATILVFRTFGQFVSAYCEAESFEVAV